jgi:micrococcal nuclease
MTKFLEKNKIFIVIITLALIFEGAIYFSKVKINKNLIGSLVNKEEFSSKACANLPILEDGVKKLVTKVIDGDTFLIEGGYSVKILGIDADERGYPCYEATKERLEELILNKEVKLEKGKEDFDQYCRYLRYVFLDEKNISLELVKEGLAVARFSPEDVKYREEISLAEKEARENKIGCKWGSIAKVEEKTEIRWEKLTEEKTGLKVIDSCQAGNYYGNEVIVEGKVVDAYRSKKNNVFLNFGRPILTNAFQP